MTSGRCGKPHDVRCDRSLESAARACHATGRISRRFPMEVQPVRECMSIKIQRKDTVFKKQLACLVSLRYIWNYCSVNMLLLLRGQWRHYVNVPQFLVCCNRLKVTKLLNRLFTRSWINLLSHILCQHGRKVCEKSIC